MYLTSTGTENTEKFAVGHLHCIPLVVFICLPPPGFLEDLSSAKTEVFLFLEAFPG